MENLLLGIAKGIVLIISLALYLKLFSSLIPGAIMRLSCKGETTRDRGLKKYVYEGGRCVVYEPDVNVRKYVKKYSLYTENGYKYLQCKISDRIRYIKYDVYAFDNKGKLLDIVTVNDYVEVGDEFSSAVAIPPETSYVRFVLRKIDSKYVSNKVLVGYTPSRYAICGVVVGLATAIETAIVYICFNDILLLINSGFKKYIIGTTGMIVVGTIICCLTVGLTLLAYYRNSKKVINR